jgi:membrane protease subunit HflK
VRRFLVWLLIKAHALVDRMFNLNEPGWGRGGGSDKPPQDTSGGDPANRPPGPPESDNPGQATPGGRSRGDGPPDLDELWRDFNRKLSGLFGGRKSAGNQNPWANRNGGNGGGGGGGGSFQPDMKSAGIGAGLVAGVVALIWLGTGFFIVQEGQQAVVTQFGKYSYTTDAGFKWRLPYPIQAHEIVSASQLRSVEVGRRSVVQSTGLKDSSMLTQDENIIDIRFTIQYRLKDTAQFLFENRNPEEAVLQAAESAVREVVGRSSMDTVLNEKREAIAGDVVKSVQAQMDRYRTGILIQSVNIQNVQPPEQVQAAFDDALKAGQDRDRLKNEGQAYANDVIPRAKGAAARLMEEAQGYRSRIVAQAEGDAQRFRQIYAEYQKAPAVTRDRLYLETMQQVYTNVTKVLVDSRTGSNLLYLPLDKLIQQAAGAPAQGGGSQAAPAAIPSPTPEQAPASAPQAPNDARSRDVLRSRDRDSR